MRKNLFISTLMLLLPVFGWALTTVELAGTWTSNDYIKIADVDLGGSTVSPMYEFTFKETGTFTFNLIMFGKIYGEDYTVYYKIITEYPGKYVIGENKVTLFYDKNRIKLICNTDDIEIEGNLTTEQKSLIKEYFAEEAPSNFSGVKELFKDIFENEVEWPLVLVDKNILSFVQYGTGHMFKRKN